MDENPYEPPRDPGDKPPGFDGLWWRDPAIWWSLIAVVIAVVVITLLVLNAVLPGVQ